MESRSPNTLKCQNVRDLNSSSSVLPGSKTIEKCKKCDWMAFNSQVLKFYRTYSNAIFEIVFASLFYIIISKPISYLIEITRWKKRWFTDPWSSSLVRFRNRYENKVYKGINRWPCYSNLDKWLEVHYKLKIENIIGCAVCVITQTVFSSWQKICKIHFKIRLFFCELLDEVCFVS